MRLVIRSLVVVMLSVVSAPLLMGCGPGSGTYCQSGAKYGTQCYSQMDVSNPPGQRPPPPDQNDDRR